MLWVLPIPRPCVHEKLLLQYYINNRYSDMCSMSMCSSELEKKIGKHQFDLLQLFFKYVFVWTDKVNHGITYNSIIEVSHAAYLKAGIM